MLALCHGVKDVPSPKNPVCTHVPPAVSVGSKKSFVVIGACLQIFVATTLQIITTMWISIMMMRSAIKG